MEVLVLHAGSKSYLWDSDVVFALGSCNFWGSNVGRTTSACAESPISMIPNYSFADNLAIAISADLLKGELQRGVLWEWIGRTGWYQFQYFRLLLDVNCKSYHIESH